MKIPWRHTFAFLALIALLAVTVAAAYIPLGTGSLLLALVIATAKALVIIAVFMELWRRDFLLYIAAAAGAVWLAILIGLLLTDYATRPAGEAPYERRKGPPETASAFLGSEPHRALGRRPDAGPSCRRVE